MHRSIRSSFQFVLTLLAALSVSSAASGQNNARFESGDSVIPSVVYAGMPFNVSITYTNTGTTTWSASTGYCLGSQNLRDNTRWGTARITHPGGTTVKDAKVTFTALLTAPETTGDFPFQWQPLKTGVGGGWFGQVTELRTIKVENPPRLVQAPLVIGYQGWFHTPNDGYFRGYKHWFEDGRFVNNTITYQPRNCVVDMWPDTTEYIQNNLQNTGYKLGNGQSAFAFSNADRSIVSKHFEWMKNYGIGGAIVGRFASQLRDPEFKRFRNTVLSHALAAAETHGVKVSVEYDLTGQDADATWLNTVFEDWQNRVNAGDTTKPEWLRQDNRPVVRIYGLGFDSDKRPYTPQQATNFLNKFTGQYSAYIIGGIPSFWRTGGPADDDAHPYEEWKDVYSKMDMLAPWTVGRYDSLNSTNHLMSAEEWAETVVKGDLAEVVNLRNLTGKKIGYLPYVFPGFSWSNLKRERDPRPLYNQSPRFGGRFFWTQIYENLSLGNRTLGISMFDEVDEGTAIFKVSNSEGTSPRDIQNDPARPLKDYFVHYSQGDVPFATPAEATDGPVYPTDWYLQLAREASKYLHGTNTEPLSRVRPINP
jgi:hypothetical protein